eukprot:1193380-Prorocentrum_minimum.AAC.3
MWSAKHFFRKGSYLVQAKHDVVLVDLLAIKRLLKQPPAIAHDRALLAFQHPRELFVVYRPRAIRLLKAPSPCHRLGEVPLTATAEVHARIAQKAEP